MRALLSWIEDFVEITESPEKVAEDLTLVGLAVDGIERVDGETLFELDVTSNRPDALNHYGLAREIAALYRRPLKTPEIDFPEDARKASEVASIEIQAPELCPRYVGRVLLGVEIKPSPDWIRNRLELCGIRSINNIADLTNYVLLELGHPTHAFDLDTLNEKRIVVRSAAKGETMRTLDGVDRVLDPDQLVIADAYRPVALAGVMGGLETEISDKTKNVLIEAAWFEPGPIRRTSRRYTMHTEASHRFERGADIEAASWAADRIAGLLGKLSPGVVLSGRLDAYPRKLERAPVTLRSERLTRLLGLEVPSAEVPDILERLGFATEAIEGGWLVELPSHRLDVEREVDLIEEVARIYGVDKIPSTLGLAAKPPQTAQHQTEDAAARAAVRSLGYDETIAYSFIAAADAERFGAFPAVPLRNPFSELAAVMRTSTIPAMLAAAAHNLHRGESDVRLAEFGRLYKRGDLGGFEEPRILTLASTGLSRPGSLFEKGKAVDLYDLKSDLMTLLAGFDLGPLSVDDRNVPGYYVEGRAARVSNHQGTVAYLGEIDPALLAEHKIKQPLLTAEVFLGSVYPAGLKRPQHRELPRLPAVHRDFSLFVPEGIPFAEVRGAVGSREFLTGIEAREVFRGKPAPEGFYGLLLRASWQPRSSSFTDEQIGEYSSSIVGALEKKLGVRQRTG